MVGMGLLTQEIYLNVRVGSWPCKNAGPSKFFGSPHQTEKNSVRTHVFSALHLEVGHCSTQPTCLKCPMTAHGGLSYSITSSARASSAGGMASPSALAVLRLMTSSKVVGCKTGRSAGFAPRNILPTYLPAWRLFSRMLLP
jgi:hypothetical protein